MQFAAPTRPLRQGAVLEPDSLPRVQAVPIIAAGLQSKLQQVNLYTPVQQYLTMLTWALCPAAEFVGLCTADQLLRLYCRGRQLVWEGGQQNSGPPRL